MAKRDLEKETFDLMESYIQECQGDLAARGIQTEYNEKITRKTALTDANGVDSLALLELSYHLENKLGIKVGENDTLDFEIVQDVIDYVMAKNPSQ